MKSLAIRTLIRREFWEYRGLLLKTPFVISAILIVLTAIGTYKAVSFAPWGHDTNGFKYEHHDGSSFRINPEEFGNWENQKEQKKSTNAGKIKSTIASSVTSIALIVSFFLSLYYLSKSLYRDRKDRSILFWRSLPVSEWETIFSKLITGMWVFPVMFVGFALIATIACLIVVYIGASILGIESILQNLLFEIESYSISAFFKFLIKAFLFISSLLPLFCWFLFASAYSKSSPMLTAIGTPIALIIAESVALHSKNVAWAIKDFFVSIYMNTDALVALNFGAVNWSTYIIMLASSATLLLAAHWLRNNRYEI